MINIVSCKCGQKSYAYEGRSECASCTKKRSKLHHERRREDRLSQMREYYKQTTKEQND